MVQTAGAGLVSPKKKNSFHSCTVSQQLQNQSQNESASATGCDETNAPFTLSACQVQATTIPDTRLLRRLRGPLYPFSMEAATAAMATSSPVLQPHVPNEVQVAFVAPNVSNRYELIWNGFRIYRPV